MKNKTMLILGGYGNAGKAIARLILQETAANVVIAGRGSEPAQKLCAELNQRFPGNRVSARRADAADPASLEKAFAGVDMVIVTAATPQYAKPIAQAALAADCDYLDILVQSEVVSALTSLADAIAQSGRIFITQGGFHPGLPAVFIRQAAPYFDQYRKANISMAMNAHIESLESVYEIIHEVGESKTIHFKNGKWVRAGWNDFIRTDFGPPFGKRICYPLQMEELKPLPAMFGLEETGVYVAGFNWFVDNLVFPLILLFHTVKKGLGVRLLARLFRWGINTFSIKSEGAVFVLDAEGTKEGKPRQVRITASSNDGYFFTAAPVVACLLQYLDGALKPELGLMGNVVDNARLMRDLERMGVCVAVNVRREELNVKRDA